MVVSLPQKEKDLIPFINKFYTLNLSMYLPKLQDLKKTPEGSIALAKVYFSNQQYKEATELIIQNKDHFINDKSLFYKRMMYHIFTNYTENSDFISNFISDTDSDFYYLHKVNNKKDIFTKLDLLMKNKEFNLIFQLVKEQKYPLNYELMYYLKENYPFELNALKNHFTNEKYLIHLLNDTFYKKNYINFLIKNNKTDFNVLRNLNRQNNKINALLMNGIFNLGTSNDSVYRETKNILDIDTWNKYIGLVLIGAIHSNCTTDPFVLMKEFLPSDIELKNGGSLLSLAFIRQYNEEDKEFLSNFISSDVRGELAYGALISLGINQLGMKNKVISDLILSYIYNSDDLYAKEGGIILIGLNFLSSNEEGIKIQLRQFLNSDNDRVKRNAGLSLALVSMGSKDKETLNYLVSNCPLERYSGTMAVGCAFMGSGDLVILKRLLTLCSDSDEDVRRGAVFGIGCICSEDDSLLIELMLLLGINHCPLVRGAVALTLGIFLSETKSTNDPKFKEVVDLLEVLLYDSNNLVIQQSCIGIGMLLSQCNSTTISNYKRIVERINALCLERDDNLGVKMGACLGRFLLGLAGECAVVSVKNDFMKTSPVKLMGAVLFYNYWFYYQFIPFISFSVKYNSVFILNEELELIKKEFIINEKRSKFDTEMVKLPEKRTRRFKRKDVNLEYVIIEEENYVIENGGRVTNEERKVIGYSRNGFFFE